VYATVRVCAFVCVCERASVFIGCLFVVYFTFLISLLMLPYGE
jgi:hypothetical protein